MSKDIAKPKFEYEAKILDANLISTVETKFSKDISEAYLIENKQERVQALSEIKEKLVNELKSEEEGSEVTDSDLLDVFKKIEKKLVRTRLLNGEARIDGRNLDKVRSIYVEAGNLMNTHGSALWRFGSIVFVYL